MIGFCLGLGGLPYYAFGVFLNPLSRSFGVPLSAINAWFSFFLLGYVVAVPTVGRLADRFGIRAVVLTTLPLFALSLASMAAVYGSVWQLYAIGFFGGAVGSGVATVTYARMVNSWFSHGRGTALGLASAGIGLGGMIGPRLMQRIVDTAGWRIGFVFMGVMSLAALPVMIAWLREPARDRKGGDPTNSSGFTFAEALRSPVFWMLGAAYVLFGWAQGGALNLIPFLSEHGISRPEAATYAGMIGVCSLLGRIATGAIIDQVPAAIFCIAIGVVQAFAFASFGMRPTEHIVLNVIIIGFAQGGEVAGFVYCTARYFGMRAYGAIYGLLASLWGIGAGVGPFLFSLVRERAGSYAVSFEMVAGLSVGAAVLFICIARHPFLPFVPAPVPAEN